MFRDYYGATSHRTTTTTANEYCSADALEGKGLAPVVEILKAVGLTANPPTTPRPLFDWLFTIARSRRLLGISILIGLNVAEDVRNSSTNKIVVIRVYFSSFTCAASKCLSSLFPTVISVK